MTKSDFLPANATRIISVSLLSAAVLTACATADKSAATVATPAPLATPPAPAAAPAVPTPAVKIALMMEGVPVDFHASVQPFLAQYCLNCHGAENQAHEIRFDLREAALGRRGLIIPGNPARSALVRVLNEPMENDEHMPPADSKQPTPEEIATIRQWVAEGAKWPEGA